MSSLKPDKILLIWIGRLGDLTVSTPFINSVRAKYPGAEITLLVRNYVLDLAKMISAIDRIITIPGLKNLQSFFSFLKYLIFTRYDLCIDMNASYSRMSGSLSVLSKAPVRLSFTEFRSNWFYTHTIAKPHKKEHMLDRYKRLADFLGAPYKPIMTLETTEEDDKKAKKLLNGLDKSSFKVMIHPGNFKPKRSHHRWPMAKFIALSRKIAKLTDVTQIYIAGPGEEEKIDTILNQLPLGIKKITNPPIATTCALLKTMDLFIGCGTATIHFAAAAKTPTIAILNHYAYECWRPLNENSVSISSGDWKTCKTVEVEKVWQAFFGFYDKSRKR